MTQESNMYADTKTWNPFKGCLFDCEYCKPSYQAQAKRQKNRCTQCYQFIPHKHPDRLDKIPSAQKIFVCGNGDISFCPIEYTKEIINSIREHNKNTRIKIKNKRFYFQSKNPKYFQKFLNLFPENVDLITTLETNRDDGYNKISKAPKPSLRYQQFLELDYPNKIVTIEPMINFDHDEFLDMIINLNPKHVWIGVNSRPKQIRLPTPKIEKIYTFINALKLSQISIGLMNSFK
jgi:hypothetical protein